MNSIKSLISPIFFISIACIVLGGISLFGVNAYMKSQLAMRPGDSSAYSFRTAYAQTLSQDEVQTLELSQVEQESIAFTIPVGSEEVEMNAQLQFGRVGNARFLKTVDIVSKKYTDGKSAVIDSQYTSSESYSFTVQTKWIDFIEERNETVRCDFQYYFTSITCKRV